MRPQRWLLALLTLFLVVGAVPAVAEEQPNNILVVDNSTPPPPPDLLDEDEVARIDRLQNEAVTTLPLSPVSPDDQTVLATSGE